MLLRQKNLQCSPTGATSFICTLWYPDTLWLRCVVKGAGPCQSPRAPLRKGRGSDAERVCQRWSHARGVVLVSPWWPDSNCSTPAWLDYNDNKQTDKQTKQEFASPRSACQSVALARHKRRTVVAASARTRGEESFHHAGTLLTNSPRSSHGTREMTAVIRVTVTITVPPEKSAAAGSSIQIRWNANFNFIIILLILFYFIF